MALALVATSLLVACSPASSDSGTHSDGDAALGAGGRSPGNCSEGAPQPIGLGDKTPFGVTPAALLAYTSGTRTATLTWGTATPEQQVTVYPAGTTTLTIDVTPKPGGVAFVQPEGGPLCGPGTLTVEADVRFRTADGGFDETWHGTLFSNDGQSLTLNEDLGQTPVSGSFRVTYTGSQAWSSTETLLTATFGAQGARGDVLYTTEMMFSTGPNSGGGGGLIVHAASWVPLVGDAGSD
jgi:hypothetical protein